MMMIMMTMMMTFACLSCFSINLQIYKMLLVVLCCSEQITLIRSIVAGSIITLINKSNALY